MIGIQYANGYLGNGREWTTCGPNGFPISTTGLSMEAAWNSPACDNDTVNLYNAAASIGNIEDRHLAQQSFYGGVFNIDAVVMLLHLVIGWASVDIVN